MVREARSQRSLVNWLRRALENESYGKLLFWTDEDQQIFAIYWLHKSKGGWRDSNIALFRDWAIFKGKLYNEKGKEKTERELKAAFRNALRSRRRQLQELTTDDKRFRYWRIIDTSQPTPVPKAKSPKKRKPRQKKSVKQTTPTTRKLKSTIVQEEPSTSSSNPAQSSDYTSAPTDVSEASTSGYNSASSYVRGASFSEGSSMPIYTSKAHIPGRSSTPNDISDEMSVPSPIGLPAFLNVFNGSPPRSPLPPAGVNLIELAERTEGLQLLDSGEDSVSAALNEIQIMPSSSFFQIIPQNNHSRATDVGYNSSISEEQEVPEVLFGDEFNWCRVMGLEQFPQANSQKEKDAGIVLHQIQDGRASPFGCSQDFYEIRMDLRFANLEQMAHVQSEHTDICADLGRHVNDAYIEHVLDMEDGPEQQHFHLFDALKSDYNC